MNRIKGILWAALSSSTFGLAPLFTLLLLGVGYSSFEVLTYRWGVASLCLGGGTAYWLGVISASRGPSCARCFS